MCLDDGDCALPLTTAAWHTCALRLGGSKLHEADQRVSCEVKAHKLERSELESLQQQLKTELASSQKATGRPQLKGNGPTPVKRLWRPQSKGFGGPSLWRSGIVVLAGSATGAES